jgi:hypothetical protein
VRVDAAVVFRYKANEHPITNRNAEYLDEIYNSGASPFMGSARPSDRSRTTPQIVDEDLETFRASPTLAHPQNGGHSHSHSSPYSHSHAHDHGAASTPQLISTDPPTTTTLDAKQRSTLKIQQLLDRHAGLQKQAKKDNNMDKVRSTLRQMIRDWSEAVSAVT